MHNPQPLHRPDSLHLSAAEGWLELGNRSEASAELNEINSALRAHPDVLEVRWRIFSKTGDWDACLEIAKAITERAPNRVADVFGVAERPPTLSRLLPASFSTSLP